MTTDLPDVKLASFLVMDSYGIDCVSVIVLTSTLSPWTTVGSEVDWDDGVETGACVGGGAIAAPATPIVEEAINPTASLRPSDRALNQPNILYLWYLTS